MPGDVGAVATLLNTLASWLFDPAGYAKLSRERKLAELTEALKVALDHHADSAVDLIFAELRRVSNATA